MHDLMNLDGRGIPGVSIVTAEFTDAVDVQSRALGFDPAVLYVPHPIQNRTREELARIADDVIEPALELLTAS
ncbi:MAG: hypothetical protein FJY54_06795 [Betaproteobacteria bacterium]|nr:hypothetical protein [Betaproteobacteria bacterium]